MAVAAGIGVAVAAGVAFLLPEEAVVAGGAGVMAGAAALTVIVNGAADRTVKPFLFSTLGLNADKPDEGAPQDGQPDAQVAPAAP